MLFIYRCFSNVIMPIDKLTKWTALQIKTSQTTFDYSKRVRYLPIMEEKMNVHLFPHNICYNYSCYS